MSDAGNQCHGGAFASTELGVSPDVKMNIIHDPKIKNRYSWHIILKMHW